MNNVGTIAGWVEAVAQVESMPIGCGKDRCTGRSMVAGISDGRTRRTGESLCVVEQNHPPK